MEQQHVEELHDWKAVESSPYRTNPWEREFDAIHNIGWAYALHATSKRRSSLFRESRWHHVHRPISVFCRPLKWFEKIEGWEALRLATDVLALGDRDLDEGAWFDLDRDAPLEKTYLLSGEQTERVHRVLCNVVKRALDYGLEHRSYAPGLSQVWTATHLTPDRHPIVFTLSS